MLADGLNLVKELHACRDVHLAGVYCLSKVSDVLKESRVQV